jgi:hypothetical protein
MITTSPIGTPTQAPIIYDDPWLAWRPEFPQERETLSVAELADCRCPDLCDRDHANE